MAEENVQNDSEKKKLSRKQKKELKNVENDKENEKDKEEKGTGKIVIFFVTLLIILIWLGIISILVKTDVGGFGSTVLYPLLKDVPYVNKILPDVSDNTSEYLDSENGTEYPYDTLDDAIARIKELELELDNANGIKKQDDETIADLQNQIQELSQYKSEQAEFEKEKEKFYEEVVFSDKAPDINEYKTYYESIDPENAEVLYKQVVEQTTYDSEVKNYAKTYSSMKPKEAAAIFDTMTDNLNLVADILLNMDTESRAKVLGQMNAETAASVTEIMEPKQK